MPDSEHPRKHTEDPDRDLIGGEVPMSGGGELPPVSGSPVDETGDDGAAWAPLRVPIFRAFWDRIPDIQSGYLDPRSRGRLVDD